MKRILVAISFAFAASCGGSNGSNGALGNFEGAAWNASVTDSTTASATCPAPFGNQSVARSYSLTFVPGNGADLQFTSTEGCLFKFNVSSYTATLANSPVSCTASISGLSATITWTSFTASTTDGRNLTINAGGNATNGPVNCAFTETGSATR